MVNLSINPPDVPFTKYSLVPNTAQLAIDETETIYEWVVESMSAEEVPESGGEDMDTSLPSLEPDLFTRIYGELPAIHFPLQHFAHYYSTCPLVHQEPHAPPPKWG